MKTIKLSISIFFLLFFIQTVTAQFGYETIEDNYFLNGPVYLYKKTILKDYTEKFGEYVAGTKKIEDWCLYDKDGRKIFEFKDKTIQGRESAYEKNIYYFDNNRLKSKAYTFTIGEEEEDFRFTFYQYPQKNVMEEFPTSIYDGKKIKGFTKKYNSKNLLIEKSEYLGKKHGYKKVYKYNSNGKKVSYTEYNGVGDIERKIIYKSDNDGNFLGRNEYNVDGKLIWKNINKYNNAGGKTESIGYDADGKEYSKSQMNYLNDTLLSHRLDYRKGKIYYEYKLEYDNKNHKKKVAFTYYSGNKVDKYTLFDYDSNDNLIKTKTFENQKLIEKKIYANYVGSQNLLYTNEKYNTDGSAKELYTYKNDKYGNIIAYEKYKFEEKFGEKKKMLVEKHKIDITYHDGTPKLEVSMKIVEEKHKNSKGKKIKDEYLHIYIKNAKAKPIICFFDKPGITKYGSNSKKNKRVETYSYGIQYSYIKGFFRPYFIVEAENEIILVKVLGK